MKDPNAAEGETKFIVGSLEDVLKQAAPGSVIYLQTPRVLEIEGYTVEELEAFDIRPDDGMFSGGVVLISSSDPREEYDPDAPVGETVYVWVGEEGSWPPPAAVLNVTSENYVASGWSNVAPVFQLSGIPEGSATPMRPASTAKPMKRSRTAHIPSSKKARPRCISGFWMKRAGKSPARRPIR